MKNILLISAIFGLLPLSFCKAMDCAPCGTYGEGHQVVNQCNQIFTQYVMTPCGGGGDQVFYHNENAKWDGNYNNGSDLLSNANNDNNSEDSWFDGTSGMSDDCQGPPPPVDNYDSGMLSPSDTNTNYTLPEYNGQPQVD
jgi:hypothetical protein